MYNTLWDGNCTFARLLLLFEVDQQEARAFRTEGQKDALQHSRSHGEGQQQGPQFIWAQQSFQTEDLHPKRQKQSFEDLNLYIWGQKWPNEVIYNNVLQYTI